MSLEAVRWSPRRWLVTIGLLFVGQIILLLYFGRREEPAPVHKRFPARVVLALPQTPLDPLQGPNDPTLLALPNSHGFSGEAWLTYRPVEYRLAAWTEPPRWLELSEARLPATLTSYLPTNAPSSSLAIQWRPRLEASPIYVPPRTLPTQSTLDLRGDLSAADLINPPVLPSWPHRDVLGRTTVRVLVLPDGSVFSAALLQECGLAEADRRALDLARQLLFKPRPESARSGPDPGFALATVLFNWHAIPEEADLTAQRTLGPPPPP